MSNTTPGTDQPVVTPPPRTRGGGIPARVMATNSSNSLRGWAFKIVLLDGAQLAELMIRHNVGARIVETLHLKKLDEDFFADE